MRWQSWLVADHLALANLVIYVPPYFPFMLVMKCVNCEYWCQKTTIKMRHVFYIHIVSLRYSSCTIWDSNLTLRFLGLYTTAVV